MAGLCVVVFLETNPHMRQLRPLRDLLTSVHHHSELCNTALCVCVCVLYSLFGCVCVDVRGMGVVAGAVVGVSFGVLLIILIIWLVFRKKEMKKYEEEETPNEIRSAKVTQCKSFSLLSFHVTTHRR